MRFRPGSLMAALSYGYSALRRTASPHVPQYVLLHKDSRNYNSVSVTQYDALTLEQRDTFEVAAVLHKHNGPELTNVEWDMLPRTQ